MSEAEILVTLKKLHDLQQEVLVALKERAETFFEEDEGDIDRAFDPMLAFEAAKSGNFHTALKVMGGAK
jgi:hypothetical protein